MSPRAHRGVIRELVPGVVQDEGDHARGEQGRVVVSNAALGGDPGAAGNAQLGRLPGFLNGVRRCDFFSCDSGSQTPKKGNGDFQARVFYSDDYVIGQVCNFPTERPNRMPAANGLRGSRSPVRTKKARRTSSGMDGSQYDLAAVKDARDKGRALSYHRRRDHRGPAIV